MKHINKQLEILKRKTKLQTQIEEELKLLERNITASFNKTKEKVERKKNKI